MSELKITIDQLKNYLESGLELYMDYDEESYVDILTGIIDDYYFTKEGEGDDYHIRGIRPFMYRLSDLDKFIPELGLVPLQELFQLIYESIYDHRFDGEFDTDPALGEHLAVKASEEVMCQDYNYGMTVELPNQFLFSINGGYATVPNFEIYQKLFQWHFWVFDQSYFEAGLVIDKLKMNGK